MKKVSKASSSCKQVIRAAAGRQIEMLESRVLLSAAVEAPIPTVGVLAGSSPTVAPTPTVVPLTTYFTDNTLNDPGDTVVVIHTPNGDIPLDLFNSVTPKTVANFLAYTDNGEYNTTIVHRSAKNTDNSRFVIQGGGYTTSGNHIDTSLSGTGVQNEPHFSNTRGSIAMAKGSDPNSATSEWFINLADNSFLDSPTNGAFTVFGKVLNTGMTVADTINDLPTTPASNLNALTLPSSFPLPIENASNGTAPSNLVTTTVSRVTTLTYTVTTDNPALVTPTITSGNAVTLTYVAGQTGSANITVNALSALGGSVSQTFAVSVGTVTLGAGGSKAVSLQQADGTVVTLSLKGPGSASLNIAGDNLQQTTLKNGTLVITGANGALNSITTTGTSAATTLNVTTKGGSKIASIGAITTDAAVGTINGKAVDLTGNLNVGGSAKNVTLHGAKNGVMTFGAGSALTFKSTTAVTGESINSAEAINSITVPGWDGGSNTTSSIAAPSIKTFTVKGDLANTSIHLTGAGVELNNLSVSGAINNVIFNGSGDFKTITAGSANNSEILSGVGTTEPNFPTDFLVAATISNVKVKGLFSNTNIAAQNLGNLSLGKIQMNNGGQAFGVAADKIAALSGTDTTTGKKFSFKKLDDPAALHGLIQNLGFSLQDFVIKVF